MQNHLHFVTVQKLLIIFAVVTQSIKVPHTVDGISGTVYAITFSTLVGQNQGFPFTHTIENTAVIIITTFIIGKCIRLFFSSPHFFCHSFSQWWFTLKGE